MAYQLYTDEFGDARNAAALCAASQFAYYPADAGAQAFQAELGMDAQLISVDNTQVYVAANDEHLLVAFRGSESPTSIDGLKDWLLTNALNLLTQPSGPLSTEFLAAGVGARWHVGFIGAIVKVWDRLYAEVDGRLSEKDRVFWITGHSLGGALALLAAWLFTRKTLPPHQVYTFGAPMVGNQAVADAYARELSGKIFRYVNTPDPVPLLPMMSLVANEFMHCEKLIPLGPSESAADLLAYLRSVGGEMAGGVLGGDISEKVWGAIKSKVTAHLLTDYRKLLTSS
jgi:triacylglycerol lipase